MWHYIGDCKTILNRGEPFNDATEMAQFLDASRELTRAEFAQICGVSMAKSLGQFGVLGNLAWAYNPKSDVHYFFQEAS